MSVKPIRLTGTSYAVLALLELNPEATPYDLKRLLQMSIENFWPVPHTTAYAEPERLATAGLLAVRQERGGRRRKRYALTAEGRDALERWRQRSDVTPPELREEGFLKIFAGADPLPIMLARRDHHHAKLIELQGYLDDLPRKPRLDGARASLLLGTGYHQKLLEAIDAFLAEQAGAPAHDGRRRRQPATPSS
jgi:PadR family transcriptional regulator, regulatory protein AphA